ncbi:MAG TPA: TonB-dependent receptor [Candidatus Angelobacter sp.]|nr:TonB-dependent receptor [Candidatus Angelobacter sp.]
MKTYLIVCVLSLGCSAYSAEIKGKVVSATSGEPLTRVHVSVLERKLSAVTGEDGGFKISDVPPGKFTLQVAAVGYRLVNTSFEVSAVGADKEFSITLVPETLRRTEVVDVKGDVFHGDNQAIPSQLTLTPQELKASATVLANDPFRAMQSLPGVAPPENDDFFGEFNVLGVPFGFVGIYVDDVVVPQPFHTVPLNDAASLSMFSTETIQEMSLMEVAYPVRYADDSGAALAIRTREGSRTRPHFTITAGMADSEFLGEGGLGSSGKGSWLVSGRRSYLNYLVRNRIGDPTTDVSFEDGDIKLNYDLTPRQGLSLYALMGHTDVNHTEPGSTANTFATGNNDLDLVRLGWRFAVTPKLLLDSNAGYIRQRFSINNTFDVPLNTDYYGEWEGGTRATWNWSKGSTMEAGYTVRRLRDSGYLQFFNFSETQPTLGGLSNDTGIRQSGFAQQSTSLFGSRVHLMAGLRWDQMDQIDFHPVTPQVSAAWQVASRTQLQFGYGRYAQFPEFQALASACTFPVTIDIHEPEELVRRSDQYSAAIEYRLSENTRVRVEGFDRENKDIIGSIARTPASCPAIKPDPNLTPFTLKDNSRGMQLILQRRSANRLSGWIGYTLAYSRQLFLLETTPTTFSNFFTPTPADQRHTVNAFAMYRLTPTISLSGKMVYGSGVPLSSIDVVAGTIVGPGHTIFGPYQRLDLRCDKAWAFPRWKMTLHIEGLNMTNHDNPRLIGSTFDPLTGRVIAVTERGLPITPTAGVTFEF